MNNKPNIIVAEEPWVSMYILTLRSEKPDAVLHHIESEYALQNPDFLKQDLFDVTPRLFIVRTKPQHAALLTPMITSTQRYHDICMVLSSTPTTQKWCQQQSAYNVKTVPSVVSEHFKRTMIRQVIEATHQLHNAKAPQENPITSTHMDEIASYIVLHDVFLWIPFAQLTTLIEAAQQKNYFDSLLSSNYPAIKHLQKCLADYSDTQSIATNHLAQGFSSLLHYMRGGEKDRIILLARNLYRSLLKSSSGATPSAQALSATSAFIVEHYGKKQPASLAYHMAEYLCKAAALRHTKQPS